MVVVLDDDGVASARPPHERRPPLWRERAAERELVGGREEHGPGAPARRVGARAVVIDRESGDAQARARDDGAVLAQARVLHGERANAGGVAQRVARGAEGLREARTDDDVGGVGDDAPGSAEVRRQRGAQLGAAARVAAAERLVGGRGQGAPQRAQPSRARERADVGQADAEVEARRADRGRGRVRVLVAPGAVARPRRRRQPGRDPRRRAAARPQVALRRSWA